MFIKKPNHPMVFGLFLVLSVCCIAPLAVYAQVLYGTIAGNVVDPSGSRVPGAEVKIVNPLTNFSSTAITDENGSYNIRNVPDGSYSLTVSLTGFKEYVAQNVAVKVSNVTRHDVTLQVGQLSDTVTVTGAATALQTDTADVHLQLETKEITDLPIGAYRNYQTLINLVPGATPAAFQNAVTDTPARALTTNVNGTARNSNNTRIDGAQSINIWLPHHSGYVPPAETIEVVNVSTNSFDAEQGFAGGAAATVITKSGTNDFHGTLFALHENSAVSAGDFFLNRRRDANGELLAKKPSSKRNIDGFVFGGPIIQNKLFFFGGFEGTYERLGRTQTATVATQAQRDGDFSGFSTIIYDPATGNPDGTGRTAFSGNKIPATRISSAASKMQALVPLPNLPGLTQNFQTSGSQALNRYNGDIKFDWYRSEKHRVWGKWSSMDATVRKATLFGAGGGGAVGGGGDGEGLTNIKVWGVGHSWTLTPKFLIDGNWGLNDMDQEVRTGDLGLGNFGQEVLGIPGTNATDPQSCPEGRCGGVPRFGIAGFDALGQIDGWSPLFRDENSYSFTQNASWSKSRHEFRFGYDVVKLNLTHWQPEIGDGPRGNFVFGRNMTALSGNPKDPTDQNAYAAYLLGLPETMGKSLQWEVMTTREWQHALYFRDRWQATKNLTLTLGLRYEYYPLVTREDRPMEQLDFSTLKLRLSNDISVSKKLFAPRVGVAYRMGDNTVIRAGYGVTYDPIPFGRPLRGFFPLTVAKTFVGANGFDPFRTLTQGIPLFTGPDLNSPVVDLPPEVQQRSMPADFIHRGYIQSWNLIYERKLPGELVVSTGYVGTQTVHQLGDLELNWAPPGTGTAGRQLYSKGSRIASTLYWDGQFSGNYHSLQVAVNRRFTHGFFVKGAYTYSKAISLTDDDGWAGLTWNDPALIDRNRAQTGYNRPHMLRLATLYDLPFGKQGDNLTNQLIRGWQINGIFSVNQNTPFTVTGGSLNANANGQTADQLAEIVNLGGIGVGSPYYDRNAFSVNNTQTNPNWRQASTSGGTCEHLGLDSAGKTIVVSRSPGNDCYGNSGRNLLRGPTWVNLDLSLFRHFKVTESMNVEFRVEAFNFANNPKFNNPNGDRSSSNFFYITSTNDNAPNRIVRFGLKFKF